MRFWVVGVVVNAVVLERVRGSANCSDNGSYVECRLVDGCTWNTRTTWLGIEESCVSCASLDAAYCQLQNGACAVRDDGSCVGSKHSMPQLSGTFDVASENVPSLQGVHAIEGYIALEISEHHLSNARRAALRDALLRTYGAPIGGDLIVADVDAEDCGLTPLCGTNTMMVTDVATFTRVPLGKMDPCCGSDTNTRTENCQQINLDARHERETGLNTAFCGSYNGMTANAETQERCEYLERQPDKVNMTLDFMWIQKADDVPCCQTCSCFGDPYCTPFGSNDVKTWRVCDARSPHNCEEKRGRCEKVVDPLGNPCVWNSAGWVKNSISGSRCQASASSSIWMSMFSSPNLKYELRLGERGVIVDVRITVRDGSTFLLNADRCYAGDDYEESWECTGPCTSSAPYSWTVSTASGSDFPKTWRIFDDVTGMESTIVCTGTYANRKWNNLRMNVDSLVVPEAEINASGAGGFCSTGSFNDTVPSDMSNAMDSINLSLDQHLESEIACAQSLDEQRNKNQAQYILRQFCGAVSEQAKTCIKDTVCDLAMSDEYGQCVKEFNGKPTKWFCRIASPWMPYSYQECRAEISDFGIDSGIVETFLDVLRSGGIGGSSDAGSCVASLEELPKDLGPCEGGVLFQYKEDPFDDFSWTNLFAVPDTVVLCEKQHLLLATEYPMIFQKPVRFTQIEKSSYCAASDPCLQIKGIDAVLKYDWPGADHTVPTPSPTGAPLQSPTASPTESPTEPPTSQSPTASPTGAPTEPPTDRPTNAPIVPGTPTTSPTESPTESPTKSPTGSPTRSPTETPTGSPSTWPTGSPSAWPTGSPSAWPTGAPTESPIVAKCDPVCPEPTQALPKAIDMAFDTANLERNIHFTAGDLVDSCNCRFDAPGAVEQISNAEECSVEYTNLNLHVACPQHASDSEALASICEQQCSEIDNDSDRCRAWELDTTSGLCIFYSNPSSGPIDLTPSEGIISGFPCFTLADSFAPTHSPTHTPSEAPTNGPTRVPSNSPTTAPSNSPTWTPSTSPTKAPSKSPTTAPSNGPSKAPSTSPTKAPSTSPTKAPSTSPTKAPSDSPTTTPSSSPTESPNISSAPSQRPTAAPSRWPTSAPSVSPTKSPSKKTSGWNPGRLLESAKDHKTRQLEPNRASGGRRALVAGNPVVYVRFFSYFPALRTDTIVVEADAAATSAVQSQLINSGAFANVASHLSVLEMRTVTTAKSDTLVFDKYDFNSQLHDSEDFLERFCQGLLKSLKKKFPERLKDHQCGKDIRVLASFPATNGKLTVAWLLENLTEDWWGIPIEYTQSEAGRKRLDKELRWIATLGSGVPDQNGPASQPGTSGLAFALTIIGSVTGLVFIFALAMVAKRRIGAQQIESDDVWSMIRATRKEARDGPYGA